MGRKKNKNVVRCIVCGVKAEKHITGDVHVCANLVCEVTAWQEIEAVIAHEMYLQEEKKGEQ